MEIWTSTLAKRILFGGDKKAIAVEVHSKGIHYTLKARKEVIVCAGAFQSPQLLMVSGIGHLEESDIEVVVDRPGVGQNMQDHIFFGPAYRVKVDTLSGVINVSHTSYVRL